MSKPYEGRGGKKTDAVEVTTLLRPEEKRGERGRAKAVAVSGAQQMWGNEAS